MVTDDNSFGTHEFLDLCSLLGCQPYIAGNVGTGSPEEMSNWLEYLNFNGSSIVGRSAKKERPGFSPGMFLSWGVGNESWGCGGDMTPEFYAEQYRRYSEFCKNYPGAPLKLIASGSNGDDYHWNETLMKNIPLGRPGAFLTHYYTIVNSWEHKGSATHFWVKTNISGGWPVA